MEFQFLVNILIFFAKFHKIGYIRNINKLSILMSQMKGITIITVKHKVVRGGGEALD